MGNKEFERETHQNMMLEAQQSNTQAIRLRLLSNCLEDCALLL